MTIFELLSKPLISYEKHLPKSFLDSEAYKNIPSSGIMVELFYRWSDVRLASHLVRCLSVLRSGLIVELEGNPVILEFRNLMYGEYKPDFIRFTFEEGNIDIRPEDMETVPGNWKFIEPGYTMLLLPKLKTDALASIRLNQFDNSILDVEHYANVSSYLSENQDDFLNYLSGSEFISAEIIKTDTSEKFERMRHAMHKRHIAEQELLIIRYNIGARNGMILKGNYGETSITRPIIPNGYVDELLSIITG